MTYQDWDVLEDRLAMALEAEFPGVAIIGLALSDGSVDIGAVSRDERIIQRRAEELLYELKTSGARATAKATA